MEEFIDSMDRGLPVHDRDIEEWGLQYAESVGLSDFVGGGHWVNNLKKHNKISGRMVTGVVTKKKRQDAGKLREAIEEFHAKLKPILEKKPRDQVYNTDQSGLNMEMVDKRSLYWQGAKRVELVVQSISATTHSYSIQPLIAANGAVHTPMLVCLNISYTLADDTFDDYMLKFPNLQCVKSNSGKFSGRDMEMWFREVFMPVAADGAVLILDQWTGYNAALKASELKKRRIDVHFIPAGATATEQVLDVGAGFNHEWKKYFRLLSNRIRRKDPDFKLSYWKNLSLLISMTLKQFTAPLFQEFFKYGWYKAHYYPDHPSPYMTPSDFCFRSFRLGSKCQCGNLCFICCAYCSEYLCYEHYITNCHSCD